MDNKTWICSCGQKNDENFCSACGKAKPQNTNDKSANITNNNDWTCPICGTHNNEKFCSNCGHNHADDTNSTNLDATQIVPPVAPPPTPEPQQVPPSNTNYTQPQQPNNYTNYPPQQQKKSTSKYIMGGIIGVLLVLVIVFGVKAMQNNKETSIPVISSSSTSDTSSSSDTKQAPTAQSDLSLGGVDLGDSIDDFHNILGLEDSTKQKDSYMFYYYANIQVGVKDGVVDALVSKGSDVETKRGIHQGSSAQDVFDKYGKDYMKFTYDGLTMYEYTFQSIDGRSGLLRFAINGNNQVQYISVRIPDDSSNSNNNAASAQEAQQALNNYYAAITNHNMSAAYNLLSADMQKHMGSLDAYAKGYQDTLNDVVTNVKVTSNSGDEVAFSYTLISRDRLNDGNVKEQTFDCTALLSKKTGSWHITNLSAKKIKEEIADMD